MVSFAAPPDTVEVFSEAVKPRESLPALAVDLGAIGVSRKIDGIVAGAKSDDVALRTTVVNDVITAEGVDGIGACAAEESVGRRGAGNGVVTRGHETGTELVGELISSQPQPTKGAACATRLWHVAAYLYRMR